MPCPQCTDLSVARNGWCSSMEMMVWEMHLMLYPQQPASPSQRHQVGALLLLPRFHPEASVNCLKCFCQSFNRSIVYWIASTALDVPLASDSLLSCSSCWQGQMRFMITKLHGKCCVGYAYTKMIEAAKAERGELILVVLGPLTNVALACKLDPQLPSRGTPMFRVYLG